MSADLAAAGLGLDVFEDDAAFFDTFVRFEVLDAGAVGEAGRFIAFGGGVDNAE